jgi:amidase
MRASPNYSRRRFLHAGTVGVAATVVAATTPVRAAAEAGMQALPPTATAPRILRKPPRHGRYILDTEDGQAPVNLRVRGR